MGILYNKIDYAAKRLTVHVEGVAFQAVTSTMIRSLLSPVAIVSLGLGLILTIPGAAKVQGVEKTEGPSCHLESKSAVPAPVVVEKVIKEKVELTARQIYFMLAKGQAPRPQECGEAESWMCAGPEHACSRDGHKIEGDDTVNWHACSCHHTCKENPEANDRTQGRKWDNKCKTRCSPSHCHCGPKHCMET
jgi:hypothetical protein